MFDHGEQRTPQRQVRPLTPRAAVGLHQAIGNAAFSRLVAGVSVQRVVELGPIRATALEQLDHLGAHVPEFFTLSLTNKKKLFGSRKADWPAKLEKYQADLHACLVEMLESDEVFTVAPSPQALKAKVKEYLHHKLQEAAKSLAASTPLAEGEVKPEVAVLHDFLRDSGRVFPVERLADLSRKADDPSTGFLFELKLAVAEIKRDPDSLVQFGALGSSLLTGYLKGGPSAFESHRAGPVGADLVFWRPRKDDGFGGEFVQAKSFKFANLRTNITAARSQLEGRNAGGVGAVAGDREISLVGPAHRGVIELEIWDGISDLPRLEKEVKAVLSSEYVHLVRVHDGIGGETREFTE